MIRKLLSMVAASAALTVGLNAPAEATTSAKVLTAASLTAPASSPYGSTVWLTGTLWRYGTSTKVTGATVYLQRSPRGRNTWVNLRTAVTNASGRYAFAASQVGAYDYRARYYGSATYTGALSRVVYPVTTQKVLFDGIGTTNYNTGAVRVTGRVYPAPPTRTPVYLYRWDGRKWAGVATGYTSGSAVTINTARPASVAHYELVVAARAQWGNGVSAARTFTSYVWRGVFKRPVIRTSGPGSYAVRTSSEARLVANPGGMRYVLTTNASGCLRFIAVTTPISVPAEVGVSWTSQNRILAQTLMYQNTPPHQDDVTLRPGETELSLVFYNGLASTPATISSDVKVLCNN